jgi:hypothetical protein
MTAGLDFVCKKIAADEDSNELRKRIAEELMQRARTGRHSLAELKKAGMTIVADAARRSRSSRWQNQTSQYAALRIFWKGVSDI